MKSNKERAELKQNKDSQESETDALQRISKSKQTSQDSSRAISHHATFLSPPCSMNVQIRQLPENRKMSNLRNGSFNANPQAQTPALPAQGIVPGTLSGIQSQQRAFSIDGQPLPYPLSGAPKDMDRIPLFSGSQSSGPKEQSLLPQERLAIIRKQSLVSALQRQKTGSINENSKGTPESKNESQGVPSRGGPDIFNLQQQNTLNIQSESMSIDITKSPQISPTVKGRKIPRISLAKESETPDSEAGTPIHHPVQAYGNSESSKPNFTKRGSVFIAVDWLKDKIFKSDSENCSPEEEQKRQRNVKKLYMKVQRGIQRKFLMIKNELKEKAFKKQVESGDFSIVSSNANQNQNTNDKMAPSRNDESEMSVGPQSRPKSHLSLKSLMQPGLKKGQVVQSIASQSRLSAFRKKDNDLDSSSSSSSSMSQSKSSESSLKLHEFQSGRKVKNFIKNLRKQGVIQEIRKKLEVQDEDLNFDIMKSEEDEEIHRADTYYSGKTLPRTQTTLKNSQIALERGINETEVHFSKRVRQMETEQQELLLQKRLKVIKQNHYLRVRWDLFVMILSVWNCITIPVDIAFEPEFFSSSYLMILNNIIDFAFFIDIILNFRTSFNNPKTGDEVMDPKEIACNYIVAGRFWVDLISTIPFDILTGDINSDGANKLQLFSMLKLFRVLRLQRIIQYMNSTDDVKLSLRLFKLFFFLILYIHCTGCLLFYVAQMDQVWIPSQFTYNQIEYSLYESDVWTRYMVSVYNSILALTGNEIYPANLAQFSLSSVLLVCGALINANIFGTIAVIAQTFNRKAQRFQEQIDVANTSMKNMKLPETLQNCVREFMMSTQSNLDNQKELDLFMNMISPSLRQQVTHHIFSSAIATNSVFCGSQELVDYLINDVQPLLYLPEDTIIQQGSNGESLFLIAKGECDVWVKDHMKNNRYVKQLAQGEYFGELSLITQQARSATVKSSNYCTMAPLSMTVFYDLCNTFPDIFIKMKQKALDYSDPWKKFQIKILQQINYFDQQLYDDEFFDEIHYYLKEEHFEKGTEIIGTAEPCTSLIFVVQGQIELQIFDQDGNKYILEVLKQGDVIGQYSVLFNEAFLFSTIAKTNVRILSLDQSFFIDHKDDIDGLEDAIFQAEEFVKDYGIPICDYKVFLSGNESIAFKFQRAVKRSIALNRMQQKSKDRFVNLIAQIQKKLQKEKKDKTLEERTKNKLRMLTKKQKTKKIVEEEKQQVIHTPLQISHQKSLTSRSSKSNKKSASTSNRKIRGVIDHIMEPKKRTSILQRNHLSQHDFGHVNSLKRNSTLKEGSNKTDKFIGLIEKQNQEIAGLKDLIIKQNSGKSSLKMDNGLSKRFHPNESKLSAQSLRSMISHSINSKRPSSNSQYSLHSSLSSSRSSFSSSSKISVPSLKPRKKSSKKYSLFNEARSKPRQIEIQTVETSKKKSVQSQDQSPLHLKLKNELDHTCSQRIMQNEIQVLSEKSEEDEISSNSQYQRKFKCIVGSNSRSGEKNKGTQRNSIFSRQEALSSSSARGSINRRAQAKKFVQQKKQNSESKRPSVSFSHHSKHSSHLTSKKEDTSSFKSDSSFVDSDDPEPPKQSILQKAPAIQKQKTNRFLSVANLKRARQNMPQTSGMNRNFVKRQTMRFKK